MATLQEIIAKICPTATVAEVDGAPMITVDDAHWHELAKALRDNGDLAMDYLVTIAGFDHVDTMGCVYYLMSTAHNTNLAVTVNATGDREKPFIHSVADLWAVAGLYEREVYDFYGIIFIGNPDMRRLFLSIDWEGYPLRKDYDCSPEANPVPADNERQSDFTTTWVENPDGTVEAKQVEVFSPQDFVVNIGPQHPATHGVLRFRTAVDGETIKKIDVYMGYIHRGIEKLCEQQGYPQTLHYLDRMDYFSAQNYHHGLCMLYERAAGIEISRRAQVIRVMMDELSRIASHCLFMGTFCMDLGATSMLFYTLRVREQILDIMERTCGARMTFNYDCIGGVMQDLDSNFQHDVKELLKVLPANIKEYKKVFVGNVIARNRMEGVGILSREDAISYGVTGPNGRASGWACDIRKWRPYSIYSELDFEEVIRTEGDAMARFKVRLDEIEQSARILEQLVDNIPEGEHLVKVPKLFKLPAGQWFQLCEGCRGVFGMHLESDGGTKPARLKFATPSMPAAGVVDHLTRGEKIADLITIGGSMDYIVPDMDR
ncbi:MAG: NADH-quinone oxidoreductase subunit D [Muribaculaceae bacterium]|nr:NADH-quinone oxidoreductase subunit D [Muribaculaceae bacterium]